MFDYDDLLLSDDDEEIIQYIGTNFYDRRVAERSDHFNSQRDKDFHRRFRLKKESVLFLLNKIEHKLQYTHHNKEALSPMNQLLCTLRFYATGSQLLTCGDFIGVHESTACRTIHKVTDAIARLYPEFIYMPTSEEEQSQAAIKGIQVHISRIPGIIIACGVLHNIARLRNDPEPIIDHEYPPVLDEDDGYGLPANNNPARNTPGNRARQVLVEQHFGRLGH
ncbi:unnamed protein product [Plutella xylostella]|uniref:(diamondback moth) hypothetical protein n=1 Tax=Plutella xylostella TaxID=51655 RepID=A0A8S4F5Z9_PLUXY|nr:unnamed protein product [Plutella xylostella]